MGTYKYWCPNCGSLNYYKGEDKRICPCCKTDTSDIDVEIIFPEFKSCKWEFRYIG